MTQKGRKASTLLSSVADIPTVVVQSGSGQTADLTQWVDSAGNVLGKVTAEGELEFPEGGSITEDYVGQRALGLMEQDQADVVVGFLTDSVGAESYTVSNGSTPVEWCYKLAVTWAAAYPKYTVKFYAWDQTNHKYVAPVTVQTGTGARTLSLFQAGFGGNYVREPAKYLSDALVSPLLADGTTRSASPDLVFVATGHNFSQNAVDQKHQTLGVFCEEITAAIPNAELVLVAQNPEWNDCPRLAITGSGTFTVTVNGQTTGSIATGASAATVQAAIEALSNVAVGEITVGAATSSVYVLSFSGAPGRWPTVSSVGSGGASVTVSNYTNGMYDWPRVMRRLASMRGYGFINVYKTYQAIEAYPGEQTETPSATPGSLGRDGTHPNQTGYTTWAAHVWSRMSATESPAFRSQQVSIFSMPTAQNLLTNGDFSDWTGTNPTGWTPAASTTLAKDTTYYESPLSWAMQVSNTGTAVAYAEQQITGAALTPLLGRYVTLLCRVRNNSASDIQGGIGKLDDGVNTSDTGTSDEGLQVFGWRSTMLKIDPACSVLKVRLYGDTGNDADSTTATFQQACLVPGMIARPMVVPAVTSKAYADTQDAASLVTAKAYTDTQVTTATFGATRSVACATTASITLSGEQTIDGFATSGSRVLVKNNATSQNGIYISSSGAWTRATDWAAGTTFTAATAPLIFVTYGTTNLNLTFIPSWTGATATIATTVITFVTAPNYAKTRDINAAKGYLLAGTTSDQTGVAPGANDTVLTADSTQAAGIKWAAPTVAVGSVTGIKTRTIIAEGSALLSPTETVAVYQLVPGQKGTPAKLTTGVEVYGQFYFDPADWQETGKTFKVVIESEVTVNGTASASSTLLFTLWTLTSPVGANATTIDVTAAETSTSLRPTVYAAGAVTANLQERRVTSSQQSAPAAGFYSLGCTLGAAQLTANSAVFVRARLVGYQT